MLLLLDDGLLCGARRKRQAGTKNRHFEGLFSPNPKKHLLPSRAESSSTSGWLLNASAISGGRWGQATLFGGMCCVSTR